jgi:hypothetical protein
LPYQLDGTLETSMVSYMPLLEVSGMLPRHAVVKFLST